MRKCVLWLCVVSCVFSVSIYAGVMLGIWKSYFDTDWHKSQCVVTDIRNSRFSSEESSDSFYYATFTVKVLHDGLWMTGFACGTPDPHSYLVGNTALNTSYPYAYGTCTFPDVCGNEVIQPIWYCANCEICDEHLTGKQVNCKWAVIDTSDSAPSADEWPQSAEIEMPRKGSSYVQVIFDDEVYYAKGEFIVLQIFGGIGIILIPTFSICCLVIEKIRK